MTDDRSALSAGVRALLDRVAPCPHGLGREALQGQLDFGAPAAFEDALAQAIGAGWIEISPLYPDRLRWAQSAGSNVAAAWVRLRAHAGPLLAQIHQASGLPVTLHVLFGQAHAVIERFPADRAEAIAEEVSRYRNPRPLNAGNTSKVFLACLPAGIAQGASLSDDERVRIREAGYSYALAADAALGCVMTAPVRDGTGTAIAALCTYGAADMISPQRVPIVGLALATAADQLGETVRCDWPLLRHGGNQLAR